MLEGYIDANMVGDVDTRNSTTDYLYTFARATISWVSRLQKVVSLSTTEDSCNGNLKRDIMDVVIPRIVGNKTRQMCVEL